MDKRLDIPPPDGPAGPPVRLPSRRATAAIAAGMLALGGLLGAALGPAPDASLAGDRAAAARALALAGIAARERAAGAAASATPAAEAPAVTPQSAPAATRRARRRAAGSSASPEGPTSPESQEGSSAKETEQPARAKLPAITNVWLIEASGSGFEAAEAAPTAAPYIDTQLIPSGTLLGGFSALQASAFASEAALAVPPAAGSAPPLLHSIVQPPCPEGAGVSACAPETPGQLTAADEFLKATLATITGTALYREHGLIVVTFASVGVAAQSELPAGSSTATLTYQPPAGAVLLSPFAKAGVRSQAPFNPTSPRRSLEALLH